jgi:hypothetical protein
LPGLCPSCPFYRNPQKVHPLGIKAGMMGKAGFVRIIKE